MKWLLRISLALGGVTALVGVLHLPILRPALSWLPSILIPSNACPVGGNAHATAQEREATRQAMLSSRLAGLPVIPLRMWGLVLGQQRTEVERALAAAACRGDSSNMVLECVVESNGLPQWPNAGTLFIRFDDQGRLVGVGSISTFADAAAALKTYSDFVAGISNQWQAGRQQGDRTLTQALIPLKTEWAFANATAHVQAIRFGDDYRVLSELQWLPQGVTASR